MYLYNDQKFHGCRGSDAWLDNEMSGKRLARDSGQRLAPCMFEDKKTAHLHS